ncbi:MAG: methyl-accepting chemotaxis protein, partial [Gammaproteobacteria bacterium]
MFSLNSIHVGTRLTVAFAVLALATLFVGVYGIDRLANLTASLTLIGEDRMPKVSQLGENVDHINLIARELRNTLIFDDQAKINTALGVVRDARAKANAAVAPLKTTITSERGQALLRAMDRELSAYLPIEARFVSRIKAGERDLAEDILTGDLRPAQLAYFAAVDDLKDYQIELVQDAVTAGHQAYTRDRNLVIAMLAIVAIASLVFAIIISRSIVMPLRRAVESTKRVAKGDLREVLDVTGRDETADLLRAVGQMQASLRDVVGRVRGGISSITTTSGQIADSSVNLSHRTESQAADIQRTASSIEEITSTVTQTATNASQANESAQSASAAALQGGNVVREVVTTMDEIRASSGRIRDIVGKIDDIAFQTNILALNAAVEAARAGEQGRGFAVVASEVRTLAQNSAKAAKEISELIADSSAKVEAGGRQVTQAGEAMEDIVQQVRSVTNLVGDITVATQEQSTGIGEINHAVAQMDQTTQQNTAMSEESAAASKVLSEEAQNLAEVVSVFQL